MPINERPPDVDPIADTGLIDWDGVESDDSNEEQALEAGEINQTPAERELQAARSDELRREAEEKRLQEERREEEQRQRHAEEERKRRDQQEERQRAEEERKRQQEEALQRDSQSTSDSSWRKKKKKKKKKDSEIFTCSLCDIKCTGQNAMDMHVRGKSHKTKERQAKLSGANQQLSSHYTSLAAAPSDVANPIYGREDQNRDHRDTSESSARAVGNIAHVPSHIQSTTNDDHLHPATPSHHVHQEAVRTRHSSVTADPRPHSPIVSPPPKEDLSDIVPDESRHSPQSRRTSPPQHSALQPENIQTTSKRGSPSRFARVDVGEMVGGVRRELFAKKSRQGKHSSDRRGEDGKYMDETRPSKVDESQRDDMASGTTVTNDAPHGTAVTEGGTLLKGRNFPDDTPSKAIADTGNSKSGLDVSSVDARPKSIAAVNVTEPRAAVVAETKILNPNGPSDSSTRAGENGSNTGPKLSSPESKSKPTTTEFSPQKQEKPSGPTGELRTFVKFGSKSLGDERKRSIEVEQLSLSENKKASAIFKVGESSEALKSVSDPISAAQVPNRGPDSDTLSKREQMKGGTNTIERTHPSSAVTIKKAGQDRADDFGEGVKQNTGATSQQSQESSRPMGSQGGHSGDSDRPNRDTQPSTNVSLAVPAPRPNLRSIPVPVESGPSTLGNGNKRKRFESISGRNMGGSGYHDRSYEDDRVAYEDRRASIGGDRLYEATGSQRRRLDDGRDGDTRRRDRYWDRKRSEGSGRDNYVEMRRSVPDISRSARPQNVEQRGSVITIAGLEKHPQIPKDWLEGIMAMAEWRDMRQNAFNKGDDVDKLVYKVVQELMLSPVVGIDIHTLRPFSRAMLKAVNKGHLIEKKGFTKFCDFPRALIQGDPKYNSDLEEDEKWLIEQDPEYLALCNVNDNIMFTFFPETDQPDGKPVWEVMDMPPRGSYGAKGQRKGPGMMLDGERAPRYPDSVAEDPLFKKIAALMASRHRSGYHR